MVQIMLSDSRISNRWFEERNPWHFFDSKQLLAQARIFCEADEGGLPYERLGARALFDEIQGRLQEAGHIGVFQWRSLAPKAVFRMAEIAAQLLEKLKFDPYAYIKSPKESSQKRTTLYFVDENPWCSLPIDSLSTAIFFYRYQFTESNMLEMLTMSALLDEVAARCEEAEQAPHWFKDWREQPLNDALNEATKLCQELAESPSLIPLAGFGQQAANNSVWLQ
jgi:hypothetical protein